MKKTVVAVIGCGRIAQNAHFPAFAMMENIRIKYACDLIIEKAQAMVDKYDFVEKAVVDYREVLADPEVEAVYVFTPNDAHYTVAMDALAAGKHTFCEKPVAVSYEKTLEMQAQAEKYGKKILLPIDHVCGASISTNAKPIVVSKENIPEGLIGMDLGPKTISQYTKIIQKARTVIWNGPMGVFEYEKFSNGTYKIAKAVAKVKGDTFVGGGDSIASIHLLKLDGFIDHISTGGGASLQLLQGELLPGVEVIENVEPKFVPATKPPKRKKRKKEPKNSTPHIDLNMYVQE